MLNKVFKSSGLKIVHSCVSLYTGPHTVTSLKRRARLIVNVRGEIAQSVERATPGEEVPGPDPHCGRPHPTSWVGVSII